MDTLKTNLILKSIAAVMIVCFMPLSLPCYANDLARAKLQLPIRTNPKLALKPIKSSAAVRRFSDKDVIAYLRKAIEGKGSVKKIDILSLDAGSDISDFLIEKIKRGSFVLLKGDFLKARKRYYEILRRVNDETLVENIENNIFVFNDTDFLYDIPDEFSLDLGKISSRFVPVSFFAFRKSLLTNDGRRVIFEYAQLEDIGEITQILLKSDFSDAPLIKKAAQLNANGNGRSIREVILKELMSNPRSIAARYQDGSIQGVIFVSLINADINNIYDDNNPQGLPAKYSLMRKRHQRDLKRLRDNRIEPRNYMVDYWVASPKEAKGVASMIVGVTRMLAKELTEKSIADIKGIIPYSRPVGYPSLSISDYRLEFEKKYAQRMEFGPDEKENERLMEKIDDFCARHKPALNADAFVYGLKFYQAYGRQISLAESLYIVCANVKPPQILGIEVFLEWLGQNYPQTGAKIDLAREPLDKYLDELEPKFIEFLNAGKSGAFIGYDPVIRLFHTKLGARVIRVFLDSRPDDIVHHNVLLVYEPIEPRIGKAPASADICETAL